MKGSFSTLSGSRCNPGFSSATSLVHAGNPRCKFPAFVVPSPPGSLPIQTFRERKKILVVLVSNQESPFRNGNPRLQRMNLSGGIKASNINKEGIGVSHSAFSFC